MKTIVFIYFLINAISPAIPNNMNPSIPYAEILINNHIADGEGFQQFVEIAAKTSFIEGFPRSQRVPKSGFHRRLGDFFQPPLLREGSNSGSQLLPLLSIRFRPLGAAAIPADDRCRDAADSR